MSVAPISIFRKLCVQKVNSGGDPIVMVTAYDVATTKYAKEGNCDVILVGDSAAMVVLGYESTIWMKHEEMCTLVSAVARCGTGLPIVADMVWGSYHVSKEKAVENAIDLIRCGAHAVKVEGGRERSDIIRSIVNAQIPVVGHIGLTPQSILELGSYKVQGKDLNQARQIIEDARSVQEAGASMLVVECMPDVLSEMIAKELKIAVIGIGAGSNVDGQVLVMHDLLGITQQDKPKFVRCFGDIYNQSVQAVGQYSSAVRNGSFPTSNESYHMADDVVKELQIGMKLDSSGN